MTPEEKMRLIHSVRWYHSIEIEEGLVTPGRIPLAWLRQMLQYLQFPESFEGLTVLDIGAWDGFFSFEAERRGARRVVALDLHPPERHGFAVAKTLLGSRVEYVQGNVYDLSPEVHGTFDVVFFFGVFYHLRYPLLALDRIWSVTDGYMLMETHYLDPCLILPDGRSVALTDIDPRLGEVPLFRFYRHDELMPGDFSNWFAPNRKAIEEALASAGFEPHFLAAWGDRIAFKAVKRPGIPEYRRQTYEGLTYVPRGDGTYLTILPLRALGTPSSAPSGSLPQVVDEAEIPVLMDTLARLQEENADLRVRLKWTQAERDTLREERDRWRARLEEARALVRALRASRVFRVLRRLGRWRWLEALLDRVEGG